MKVVYLSMIILFGLIVKGQITTIYKTYLVSAHNVSISLNDNDCNSFIKESIVFELYGGSFNTITRRISLKPNIDDYTAFKIKSNDLTIYDTILMPGCENYNSKKTFQEIKEDICIMISFRPIQAVVYEYTAISLLKYQKSPFQAENLNALIYTIDNSKRDIEMKNIMIKLQFNFQNKVLKQDIKVTPTEFLFVNEKNISNTNSTVDGIIWKTNQIKKGDIYQIQMNMKEMVLDCEDSSKPRFYIENNDNKFIIFIWVLFALLCLFILYLLYRLQSNAFRNSRPKYNHLIE